MDRELSEVAMSATDIVLAQVVPVKISYGDVAQLLSAMEVCVGHWQQQRENTQEPLAQPFMDLSIERMNGVGKRLLKAFEEGRNGNVG